MHLAITNQSPLELGKRDKRGKVQVAHSLEFLRLPGLDPNLVVQQLVHFDRDPKSAMMFSRLPGRRVCQFGTTRWFDRKVRRGVSLTLVENRLILYTDSKGQSERSNRRVTNLGYEAMHNEYRTLAGLILITLIAQLSTSLLVLVFYFLA